MDKKFDVLCIGAAIVDLPVGPVDSGVFAREASFPVDGIRMTIGGDAINESTILCRLGRKVALASCVGDDVPGRFVLDHCKNVGIDTSNIRIRPELDTSINVALVTADGERTFITNRQGTLWKYCEDDFDLSILKEVKIVSFSFFNTPLMTGKVMERIFGEAKKQGVIVCADMIMPRLGETLEDIKGALQYVDYFFPNQDEAAHLSRKEDIDEICDTFLACGVKNVILKTGKKGCLVKNAKERTMVPGYAHSKVVDTIGAGDNFEAGFIAALLDNRMLMNCARFAHSVASLSVEAAGATNGVTSAEKAEERFVEYIKSHNLDLVHTRVPSLPRE